MLSSISPDVTAGFPSLDEPGDKKGDPCQPVKKVLVRTQEQDQQMSRYPIDKEGNRSTHSDGDHINVVITPAIGEQALCSQHSSPRHPEGKMQWIKQAQYQTGHKGSVTGKGYGHRRRAPVPGGFQADKGQQQDDAAGKDTEPPYDMIHAFQPFYRNQRYADDANFYEDSSQAEQNGCPNIPIDHQVGDADIEGTDR